MIPWEHLTDALDELDTIRTQLGEARAHERTARFHHLLRTRMVGANRGEHIADVIELAEGWVVVHWLHDPKSVGLYSSILKMRQALGVGGEVLLSLVDASERTVHDSRRAQTSEELTSRQKQVLIRLGHGETNQQIAEHLNVSHHTVRNLLTRAMRTLGTSNRNQTALMVRDMDLTQ